METKSTPSSVRAAAILFTAVIIIGLHCSYRASYPSNDVALLRQNGGRRRMTEMDRIELESMVTDAVHPVEEGLPQITIANDAGTLEEEPKQLKMHVDSEALLTPYTSFTAKFQKLFPLRYRASNEEYCITPEEIVGISSAIRTLYVNYNIRVFPRNGFLLGIIRHGGFLPNEHADADLGVIATDLTRLEKTEGRDQFHHGGFGWKLNPTEDWWVNWKGRDPVTQEPYPFFGVNIHAEGINMHANSAYPWRDTGTYFYPRLDIEGHNHEAHVKDSLRYNDEGADYRLVDTDQRLTADNFQPGVQIGTIFDTPLDCMMDWQFYFTTILVPCDYDVILTSLYGRNWNHVENRGEIGQVREGKEVQFESHKVSDEENEQLLHAGPKPLCAA